MSETQKGIFGSATSWLVERIVHFVIHVIHLLERFGTWSKEGIYELQHGLQLMKAGAPEASKYDWIIMFKVGTYFFCF